jgi:hypothetical protein
MTIIVKKQEDKIGSILNEIPIPEDKLVEIASQEIGETIRDLAFNSLGIGHLTNLFNLGERINKVQKEWKRGKLLQFIIEESEDQKEKQKRFENFVTDPQGNILYNKVIRLVDDNPPNTYYIKLLANALKTIHDSDFKSRFSKHIYVLNQIEKLTSQALLLLSDYNSWPEFIIGNYSSDGEFIDSSWVNEFLASYAPHKEIKDKNMIDRMAHSFLELEQNELLRSKTLNGSSGYKELSSIKEDKTKAKIVLTPVGNEIFSYIK